MKEKEEEDVKINCRYTTFGESWRGPRIRAVRVKMIKKLREERVIYTPWTDVCHSVVKIIVLK